MNRIPLGTGAYQRTFGDFPEVKMENRFFESNPTSAEETSLLSRPGTANLFGVIGTPPFHAVWTKDGVFDGDLFYVASNNLYRLELAGSPQLITSSVGFTGFDTSFAASTGLFYTNLFVTDDGVLRYYEGESFAKAFVTTDLVNPPLDQEVRIGTIHYKFRGAGTVDDGTPDGSSVNPFLLDYDSSLPSTFAQWAYALEVLSKAVNATGEPGVDYSSTLTDAHGSVFAIFSSFFNVACSLQAKTRGTAGNSLEIESVSGGIIIGNASGIVSTGTLNFEGGGVHELVDVVLPDSGLEFLKVVSVGAFVLAIERQSNRFFFIRPGEVQFDPLDYESAEAEPDQIVDAITVGDFVYLLGRSSIEAWYVAGDAERPIQRLAGSSARIGAVADTAALVQQTPVFVGVDNVVYAFSGGNPQRISNHGIEERLRTAGLKNKVGWSFSLDGHFFYVLSIEDEGTFVYDATTQQWHRWWTEGREPYWTVVRGTQWRTFSLGIDWDGDDIWQIDPSTLTDETTDENITRIVMGFLPLREKRHARNSLVRVFASLGNPQALDPAPVLSLRFSDDNGKTWVGPYEVTLTDEALQQIDFRSLGRVGFPGRLYEFTDTAGLLRIDGAYAELE